MVFDEYGSGFASGFMSLGMDLEVTQVVSLEKVWAFGDVCFSRPTHVPDGFNCVGHYASQPVSKRNRLMLVRHKQQADDEPALRNPETYALAWKGPAGYLWLPVAPPGYKALGFVATITSDKPPLEEVVCAREDLTSQCQEQGEEICSLLTTTVSSWRGWKSVLRSNSSSNNKFYVWRALPLLAHGQDVCLGTFHGGAASNNKSSVATLRNSFNYGVMPSKEQVDSLMCKYAPVVLFHPDEVYLPASVKWFFEQGALVYSRHDPSKPCRIEAPDGGNLPVGGSNDGEYWLDLPADGEEQLVKCGDLSSAQAYVHAKAMLGGAATDLQLWLFYPFNGPATLKLGLLNLGLTHIGEHVCDWEHVTVRINNLDGTLSALYFAQHSSGQWLEPEQLEYDQQVGRPLVYSSKHGHAAYPHPGDNLQGNAQGVGIKNQTRPGGARLDLATHSTLVSADYLGVTEPHWLNYMRQWGPKLEYKSRAEIDKLLHRLPATLRKPLRDLINAFPNELYGQEGPTGPKQKDYWIVDER